MENSIIMTSKWRYGDVIDDENSFFWLFSKLYVDNLILVSFIKVYAFLKILRVLAILPPPGSNR